MKRGEMTVRVMLASALVALAGCVVAPKGGDASPAFVEVSGNDCAVIAAVAKEHYKFGADNKPPPLRGLGDAGWRPQCDWSKYGLAFDDYNDVPKDADPRTRLKWVEFKQPRYSGEGALIETGIMHGPLAGMGYECCVRSGFAGWTVSRCRNTWVS